MCPVLWVLLSFLKEVGANLWIPPLLPHVHSSSEPLMTPDPVPWQRLPGRERQAVSGMQSFDPSSGSTTEERALALGLEPLFT